MKKPKYKLVLDPREADEIKKISARSSDSTQIYLNELNKSMLLTAQEEIHFGRLVQQGDQLVRQRMIESNLRLVVKISKKS